MDGVGSKRERRSVGRTGTQRVHQGLCYWLTVWPWTGCAQRGVKAKICLWLYFFFFSQSQQENICFFYTFLVYLSWDLQLCCCCSICFNCFEAIADFLVPKLSGCPCCLYVRSYLSSRCHEPRKKDKEKLWVFYAFCFYKPPEHK